MLISPIEGAAASTVSSAASSASEPSTATASGPAFHPPAGSSFNREHARHMVLGTPAVVKATIKHLHQLGYAEPNDWSRLISTGRTGEVMAILTKRVSIGEKERL